MMIPITPESGITHRQRGGGGGRDQWLGPLGSIASHSYSSSPLAVIEIGSLANPYPTLLPHSPPTAPGSSSSILSHLSPRSKSSPTSFIQLSSEAMYPSIYPRSHPFKFPLLFLGSIYWSTHVPSRLPNLVLSNLGSSTLLGHSFDNHPTSNSCLLQSSSGTLPGAPSGD